MLLILVSIVDHAQIFCWRFFSRAPNAPPFIKEQIQPYSPRGEGCGMRENPPKSTRTEKDGQF